MYLYNSPSKIEL